LILSENCTGVGGERNTLPSCPTLLHELNPSNILTSLPTVPSEGISIPADSGIVTFTWVWAPIVLSMTKAKVFLERLNPGPTSTSGHKTPLAI